jgi:hypothetical protein
MSITFDLEAAHAAFAMPHCDGSFDVEFEHYLRELGETRLSVVLAFAPKAAGTYLRSAAIVATGGQLVRTVHAQGGRDASFYLPAFLAYYTGGFPARTLVTHVHMQALPANRHFIEALDLKPVIMLRAIPDMLASYWDMLEIDHLSPDNWLNLRVPAEFIAMSAEAKGDFMIEMFGPWFVSYFATWLDYAAAAPRRVLMLDYDDFRCDPVTALERLLAHSGMPCSREACQVALDAVWEERADFRFNQGVSGRGRARFTPEQIAKLERQLAFYPNLAKMRDRLISRR